MRVMNVILDSEFDSSNFQYDVKTEVDYKVNTSLAILVHHVPEGFLRKGESFQRGSIANIWLRILTRNLQQKVDNALFNDLLRRMVQGSYIILQIVEIDVKKDTKPTARQMTLFSVTEIKGSERNNEYELMWSIPNGTHEMQIEPETVCFHQDEFRSEYRWNIARYRIGNSLKKLLLLKRPHTKFNLESVK